MSPDAIRHSLILLGLVGAALGVVYVAGDGFQEAPTHVPDGSRDSDQPFRDPGEEPHRRDGVGLGTGKRGRVEFDQSVVIDGARRAFRAWYVSYAQATPRESDDPENPDLIAEKVELASYPKPSPENPNPRAELGPGATFASADHAEIARRDKGTQLHAELRNNVIAKHYDLASPSEDGAAARPTFFTLETDALTIDRGADNLIEVQSDRVVTIRNEGHSMTGTGMSGSSGLGRLEFHSKVSGAFDGESERIEITCDGKGSVEAIDPRDNVRAEDRQLRRFEFTDNIKTRHGPETMTCKERLIIDVPRDEEEGAGGDPDVARRNRVSRMEAYGDFHLVGKYGDEPYSLRCDDARSWRGDGDRQFMQFLGGTEMVYDGQLGRRDRADPKTLKERRVRLRIVCSGTASSEDFPRTEPEFKGVRRFALTFRENVIVTQEDLQTGEVISRLEAETVILTGNFTESTGRDPEFLKAYGKRNTAGQFVERVHLVHQVNGETVDSTADGASFTVDQTTGGRRIELAGRPHVKFQGKDVPNPFGAAPLNTTSSLILTCDENVEIWEAPRPPGGARPVSGMARRFLAQGNVRLRKIVSETEPLFVRAATLEAQLGWDNRLLRLEATGNARLEGRAEDGSGRRGWAAGNVIKIGGLTPAKEGSEPTEARIQGNRITPAIAEIHDTDDSRHTLRGDRIEYLDRGRIIEARQNAYAALSRRAGEPLVPGGKVEELGGTVEIFSPLIRAEMTVPPTTSPNGTIKPQRQLVRVNATGPGTRLAGRAGHSVSGTDLHFDAVNGKAEVTGGQADARVEWSQSVAPGVSRVNWVISPKIRATFHTDGTDRGKLRQASCDGGTIQGFLVPRAKEGEKPDASRSSDVQRIIVKATGPITLSTLKATASGNVNVRYESLFGRTWRPDSQVLCDRAEITFDRAAKGKLENRIKRLVATGTAREPVRFRSPKVDAEAERMETLGDDRTIHLTAENGRSVEVHSKTEGYRYRCTPGCRVNYRTLEWNSSGRSELILD